MDWLITIGGTLLLAVICFGIIWTAWGLPKWFSNLLKHIGHTGVYKQ